MRSVTSVTVVFKDVKPKYPVSDRITFTRKLGQQGSGENVVSCLPP